MGTMTDKILCPWCGAEMYGKAAPEFLEVEWCACYICPNELHVSSPLVRGFETKEKALEAARAAALRRYTPPAKPLTLTEARERNSKDLPLFVESRFTGLWHGLSPAKGWVVGFGWLRSWVEPDAEPVGYIEKGYGRYWRCWDREPTGEERSAAEWET